MNEAPHSEPEQSNLPGRQPGFGFSHMPPRPGHPPQPQMSPGFGYVQQPGYAGCSLDMPQRVKAARIVLFLLTGFLIILGLAALAQAEAAQSALDPYSGSPGFMAPAVHEAEQEAAAHMVVAQSGMLWDVIYGAWLCVVGTFALGLTASIAPATNVMAALVEPAAGVLLIVFMVQKDGVTWFSRPRH
ncbi:hypothetical protein [Streptomyces sp. Ncost-T10-10d]|uniref:hypothetical protein n=1 Tax=Streptomyces sp. Ncost-T10-10d TaxID=1839774 RepID=UPI00081D808F|nr:hypothetical protein [Streptomyces sp. Ncost-T10-10d]SCF68835.1 hypothetical protein GA0115254_111677 [Streptomyces sp. Ncost-T10-10d]